MRMRLTIVCFENLTFWEIEIPSRISLGKKYGGPFTNEEIEDVKTFPQLLKLLFSLSVIECFIFNSRKHALSNI